MDWSDSSSACQEAPRAVQTPPQGSKEPKYGVSMVSVLGNVIMVLGRSLYLGTWTLRALLRDYLAMVQ